MRFYGLHANNCGTCVKKPMTQCSGEEIMREFLYYCGLEDKIDEIMPRKLKDRPEVIPAGNRNLAFIGQFVELEGDVVFTAETPVRTAMIAVYRMLHLDRPITPLFQGQYDIRMVNVALKTLLGKDKIEVSDLPKVNPLKLPQTMHEIVNAINQIPPVPEIKNTHPGWGGYFYGTPDTIRTCDLQSRSFQALTDKMLYFQRLYGFRRKHPIPLNFSETIENTR